MTCKQKKLGPAGKRIKERAKNLLDPEVYKKSCEVGRAKYNSLEDFVQAVVDLTRWARNRDKTKKSA